LKKNSICVILLKMFNKVSAMRKKVNFNKKLFYIILLILLAFFLSSFEFFHIEETIEDTDKCPICTFEQNAKFFIHLCLCFLLILLYLVYNRNESLPINIPKTSFIDKIIQKRAPPFFLLNSTTY